MTGKNDFVKVTDVVITQLEGGYYHPNMLQDGRVKDQRYKSSGETMYGLDRKNGPQTTTPDGIKFWSLIDSADAKNKWPWNYMGGSIGPQLRQLAGSAMYDTYKRMYSAYLSPAAQAQVDKDPRLVFNFAYAAWNGDGWFKRFAGVINAEVAKGNTDSDSLVAAIVQARINSGNSLIAQGGKKIAGFINSLLNMTLSADKKKLIKSGVVIIAAIGLSFLIYFATKSKASA